MTQEEKSILLQDLCARLTYGVMVQCITESARRANASPLTETLNTVLYRYVEEDNIELKPYLRPMSNMTEEERADMGEAIKKDCISPYGEIKSSGVDNLLLCTVKGSSNLIDWLNKHYFDYHGLIDKGLALEAPTGMYKL